MITLSNSRIVFIVSFLFYVFAHKVYADVVINEFSPHPSAENKEWVEFYNPDRVALTSYWIDDDEQFGDDSGSGGKKQLTTIQTGHDPAYQFFELSSLLNNSGDKIVLFDGSGKIVDRYEYTKDPGVDLTIGCSPDGTGEFDFLVRATRGEINSDVLPTITLTPTTTPTPTHTPTPTKVPTPTKSLSEKTPTPTKDGSSDASKTTTTKKNKSSSINLSGVPTAILGASSAAQKKSVPTKKKNNILVKDATAQRNPLSQLIIVVGSLCLIASGIIVFIKRRNLS